MSLTKLQESMFHVEQVDCPVEHLFTDGCYARKLTIPAGVCIVGAKHKTNHFLMIFKGACAVVDNDGQRVNYQAPKLLETKAGTKRAITAYTETTLITFHVTDETDPIRIGNDILEDEQIALPQWKQKKLEKN